MTTSRSEWSSWKEHPVTQDFFSKVRQAREELFFGLATFQYVDNPKKQDQVIGMISSLSKILETDYED